MPKRSSKHPAEDANQAAFRTVRQLTRDEDVVDAHGSGPRARNSQPVPEKNPAAVALGRLGGKKGGKARAAKLTPEQRSEIARKAAAKRWRAKSEGGQ